MVKDVPRVVESVPRVVEVEEDSHNDFPWPPPDVVDKWDPDYRHNMNEKERLLLELNHYSHTFPYWTLPFVPQPREPYIVEPKVMVNVPRLLATNQR